MRIQFKRLEVEL